MGIKKLNQKIFIITAIVVVAVDLIVGIPLASKPITIGQYRKSILSDGSNISSAINIRE